MDSTDSQDSSDSASHSSSPSPKRRHALNDVSDTGSSFTCIRFLVSNAAAGCVIGKGGTTISDFQSQSGSKIQLSRNHEYYPGTYDRVISLSGTINEVLIAFNLILSKLFNERENDVDVDQKPNQVTLVIPNSVSGAIIGRGGATIKSFIEESQATIKLSPQEQTMPGLSDRLVTITGTLEQQLQAVSLIITKLSEDKFYTKFANSPLSYTGASLSRLQGFSSGYGSSATTPIGYGLTNYGSSGTIYGSTSGTTYGSGSVSSYGSSGMNYTSRGANYGSSGANDLYDQGLMPPYLGTRSAMSGALPLLQGGPQTTVTIAVPDERVGSIVGRGGRIIIEIQKASGANIKISDRGDFLSGTNDRKVTISGSAEAVRIAQRMLSQKITSDLER